MKPDERAWKVVQDGGLCCSSVCTYQHECLCMPGIAAAIREAENDALERAAKSAERIFGGPAHTYGSENSDLYRAQDDACARIAKAIRSLKSPVEPLREGV